MTDVTKIRTLIFANNAISARMAYEEIKRKAIPLDEVALILLRQFRCGWQDGCGITVTYGASAAHSRLGQLRAVPFYLRSARMLRLLLRKAPIARVYVVNSDNLLTNHAIQWAQDRPEVAVSVLVEGIMNFQDITLRNRDAWRTTAKKWIAPLLGLRWQAPAGHLSGAWEPGIASVISFARTSLHAPEEKIDVLPFGRLETANRPSDSAVLIIYSGLWQWMPDEDFRRLVDAFIRWLDSQDFDRILVKAHPHVHAGYLEEAMPPHEIIHTDQSLEDLAADLSVGTVAGLCCTGSVTLRLLRPDIRCVDFGADFYCDRAYFGDQSVIELMRSVGVETIPMVETAAAQGVEQWN